ncbi:hypothetical protein IPG41_06870 [Candidatus Peregrinibacteria bacterium]|nr:MAG: hypothetical protein IPG41_06870 [Candidatus Peregrinibacteria bacterium]
MDGGGFTYNGSGFVGNFGGGGAQDPQGQVPPAQNPPAQNPPAQNPPVQAMPAYPDYAPPAPPSYPQAPMANQGAAAGATSAAAPLAGMGDPYGAQGDGSQPGFDPNYRFAEKMKNFTTTVKLPANSIKVDEAYFLNLLAGSISLTRDEKKKIVDSFDKLRQEQVDELIRIFEEERSKFIELSSKHGAQLKKLEDEHAADWRDIEISYTAATKKAEEDAKAEAIRQQLGLN